MTSAEEKSFFEEVARIPELREKLLFSVGISLAQAFIIGARDRVGGIRINLDRLMNVTRENVVSGVGSVTYNIDVSSALDNRVFDRGLENFLISFALNGPQIFKKEGDKFLFDDLVLQGFQKGYESAQEYFLQNHGRSSDTIRRLTKDKVERIFVNLNMPIAEITEALEEYRSGTNNL